ncbi:MAG: hypothetical protein IJN67_07480 [Oscillospiraceae bacterium]|nr:hypothetical protein [Oscillospiraceae bacterium]
MFPYKLPIKFILLWIANLAVLLTISLTTGFHEILMDVIRGQVHWIYLAVGGILAGLEEALWDKLKGN